MLPEIQFCTFNKIWTGNINMACDRVDTYLCFLCTHSSFLSHDQAVNIFCAVLPQVVFGSVLWLFISKKEFQVRKEVF